MVSKFNMSSVTKMLASCVVACTLISLASAQANGYLPPSKGYNYDVPSVPFPTNSNPVKQPLPIPYRPPTTAAPYRPPVTQRPVQPAPRPTYVPPPPAPTPHQHHEHHEHHDHEHHEPGMPFDFSYAVNEDGNDYSHNAVSDGDVTRGEYRIALPDGRTQIVKYTADWRTGFNAEVTYQGEASYPDQPNYNRGSAGARQGYIPPQQGNGYKY